MLADRRAKIVATIGPATSAKEHLRKAIEAGMNVARINFSHGHHEEHLKVIQSIRELSRELRAPVTILQDLQGPKIRVGHFIEGFIELKEGEEVKISPNYKMGERALIPSDFKELPKVCQPGTKILLDDGLLELLVLNVVAQEVICKVIHGGILKNRKGMNLPGVTLPVDCLTEKDLVDLDFGLKNKVDYVALSFVRYGSDIKKLQELIQAKNPGTKVIAKIEMLEALENLEEIIDLSDAIMVARGDLAVEVGQSQLPRIQKRIIRLCNQMKKPVITATQMLDSMVENPRPTRAEITDVANAVIDGTDALMLSAESASGKYPFKCISTMHEIIMEVERDDELYYKFSMDEKFSEIADSISSSACLSAFKLDATAIVCLTSTGKTATFISRIRPKCRIIAVTHIEETLNRLELAWGIQTFAIKPYRSADEAMFQIEEILLKYKLVNVGDKIILTLGVPVLEQVKTNSMRVYTISGEIPATDPKSIPLRCK
ncbi:MAG: pyruvate kinase [Bdellovibrionaceae bacterium]|nr:pyruvate kinase [Pseudobdellovibrionaceae bacterium]